MPKQPVLKQCATRLTSYTGEDLCVKGQCVLSCRGEKLPFFVVDTNQDPVLGLKASQDLNIIKIVHNVVQSPEYYLPKYPTIFNGLGCLSKPYHIKVDPTVQPVITSQSETIPWLLEIVWRQHWMRWTCKKNWSTNRVGKLTSSSGKA